VSAGVSDGKYYFNRVALIGTGLIGGSIGIALREKRLVEEVVGYDLDSETNLQAVMRGAVDSAAGSAPEAVRKADLVILAVPVMSTIELLKEIIPSLSKGAIITDVGSTKARIMASAEQILPPGCHFIGGHPMAGSEESGIRGADPALLENAIYVLTPGPDVPGEITGRLSRMFEEAGAQPIILDPLGHDRAVAMVSHLPHITAAALVQSASGEKDIELLRTLAAGGFRDSTRIALGNPEVWRDICISNRWALLAALKSFKASLDSLEKYLTKPDSEAVREYLLQARDFRSSIPHRGRGILPEIYELVVLVRDSPGVLGSLTSLLGDAGVNIDAIEIVHVRELAGGSIRLGFKSSGDYLKAQELLKENKYRFHSAGS
jgi:prephenate dehydrogenase